jgi:uncharacterized protein YjdB/alpha-tubulin suppressor-like RCC1 family protein
MRTAGVVAGIALLLAACGGDDSATPSGPKPPPTPASVATVDVAPGTTQVAIGRTTQLAATMKDAAGTVLSGRTVSWSSSDAAIATVDASGVVTGIAVGAATVTATSEGKSAQAAVTVKLSPVASVVVTPNTPNIKLGEVATLAASVRDDRDVVLAGREVRWTSSAPAVATVDAATGVVTAVSGGQAKITATSDGVSGSATVTVTVPVATVAVNAAPDTLEAYDQLALTATLRDAKGNVLTGRAITWTSSAPTIASIDAATGVLTGLDRGTVTVTATSEGKSGSATHTIVIRYRSVAAGTMHACDIASGGIAWCWGLNGREGRIGSPQVGDNLGSATPVRVGGTGPGAIRFAQLSAYGSFTCGIATDGRAYCWGSNSWSTLGDPSAGSYSITPVAVTGGLTFRQISVGADHACALAADGRAFCWGHNDWRQFGAQAPGSSATPVAVAPSVRFASISAGSSFTCGVATTGTTYCFGASGWGQLGDGSKISYGNTFSDAPVAVVNGSSFGVVDAAASYACALATGGRAFCWGGNGGKLGNGGTTESSTPVAVTGGISFASISTGNGHACGVATDASLWCWGANGNGQLGAAAANGTTAPVRAGGSLRAAEVSASGISTGFGSHTCAISADRLTTYCFGRNDAGQLGNGSVSSSSAVNTTPSIVVGQKPL